MLERIGDKWTVFVIVLLKNGPLRFRQLKRSSQKMPTTTLLGLERNGLVTRTVTPTIPPRVDDDLTNLGRDILIHLDALADFTTARSRDVESARTRYGRYSRQAYQLGLT